MASRCLQRMFLFLVGGTLASLGLHQAFPQIPLVAALETAFHETIPPEIRGYAIPHEWEEQHGVKRRRSDPLERRRRGHHALDVHRL